MRVVNARIVVEAVVQHAGRLNVHPRRLPALVAVRPVGRQTVIGMRINQFQAAPAAAGPLAPASARAVGHLVFLHVNGVGPIIGLGLGQGEQFALVREFAAVVAVGVAGVEIGVIGKQIGRVLSHHHVAIGTNERVGRKRVRHSCRELPAGQIDRIGPLVVKFDVLIVVVAADRVIHQFVDHNVADHNRAVVRPRRVGRERVKIVRPVRPAPIRNPVGLRPKLHRVQNPAAVGLDEVERFALAVEREAQLRLGERHKTGRPHHRARWNDKLIGRRIIGQNTTRNVHAGGAVIVKFDELRHGRILAMRQNLIDHHAPQRAGGEGVPPARRAARLVADVPRPRIALAVGRVGQHDGVPRAAGRHRPGINIGVGHSQ